MDSGSVEKQVKLSDTATFIKIESDTDWFARDSITLKTDSGVYENIFSFPSGITYTKYQFEGSDLSRTTTRGDTYIESVTAYVDRRESGALLASSRLASLVSSASVFDFWTYPIQDTLKSSLGHNIRTNGTIAAVKTCTTPATKTIPETVLNKSRDGGGGTGYNSEGMVNFKSQRLGGSTKGKTFYVNPVQIHTPIYNSLTVNPTTKNQLSNVGLASGYPIVTLGGEVVAKVELNGPSHYYTSIDQNIEDLVKDVYIECELCERTIHAKVHKCTVPVSRIDNRVYKIKSTVIAENNGTSGTESRKMNTPDNIYIIKQEEGVYVAGKIYDLEVRTTDDPGWKLRVAEKLAKLPLGEQKDNAISAYKYAVKLGYRAYFDMKTLGVAINDVRITPKIYYVTKEGKILEDVEYYYRTSATEYKKLETNDIEIRMNMMKTKGEVNNPDFKMEILNYLSVPSVEAMEQDYRKELNIGGLVGEDAIILDKNNSTSAKYEGKWYADSSRRWYGEIYMPASTIVVEKGAKISDIARGKDVYKDGYILITFNPIKATLKEGEEYLRYSVAQNPRGEAAPPYVLLDEKQGKNNVILPNGIEIKNLPEYFEAEEAPIIIYDVSLRANDDYEATGTH